MSSWFSKKEVPVQEVAISIQGVSKSYGRVQALQKLDLSVQRGEIFGFLGPNGAGKTTTIRCLLDLIRPQQGEIRVMGIDPRRDPVAVRARCGYLPGELHMDDNLTAEAALRFFFHLRQGKIEWKYARALAERLDLDLTQRIKNLSKGNKQKVGLVQALMHRPDVLLLDEPTAGLDPLVQQNVMGLVVEAAQAGATVFFSSHILSEVQAIAERVGIIRQGVLIEVAQTENLLRRSLRRLRLRFTGPVDPGGLLAVPGVTLLAQPAPDSLHLEVTGSMEALVKALGAYPVQDLETERPSLEEVFLAYYRAPEAPLEK
jgi:ABC-2 type transport system ATP-binding protein